MTEHSRVPSTQVKKQDLAGTPASPWFSLPVRKSPEIANTSLNMEEERSGLTQYHITQLCGTVVGINQIRGEGGAQVETRSQWELIGSRVSIIEQWMLGQIAMKQC